MGVKEKLGEEQEIKDLLPRCCCTNLFIARETHHHFRFPQANFSHQSHTLVQFFYHPFAIFLHIDDFGAVCV